MVSPLDSRNEKATSRRSFEACWHCHYGPPLVLRRGDGLRAKSVLHADVENVLVPTYNEDNEGGKGRRIPGLGFGTHPSKRLW